MLTAQQREAAGLLGAGLPLQEVAKRVNVHVRSLRRWASIPEFAQIVDAGGQNEDIVAVFRAALTATKESGEPDYTVRMRAAEGLAKLAPMAEPPPPAVITRWVDRRSHEVIREEEKHDDAVV